MNSSGEPTGPRPAKLLYQRYLYHHQGLGGFGNDAGATPDEVVYRQRDTDDPPDGELDETLYYLQNHRGDLVALSGETEFGWQIVERVSYSPYGDPTWYSRADIDMNGVVDENDWDYFMSLYVSENILADFNHDGEISDYLVEEEFDDLWYFEQIYTADFGLESEGKLSNPTLDNRIGFAGYVWDPRLKLYHVRHRVYDPRDARWLQRDPLGYAEDGLTVALVRWVAEFGGSLLDWWKSRATFRPASEGVVPSGRSVTP